MITELESRLELWWDRPNSLLQLPALNYTPSWSKKRLVGHHCSHWALGLQALLMDRPRLSHPCQNNESDQNCGFWGSPLSITQTLLNRLDAIGFQFVALVSCLIGWLDLVPTFSSSFICYTHLILYSIN